MATESIGARAEHVRSMGVTTLCSLAGIAAAVASWWVTQDLPASDAATETLPLLIVALAIALQFPLLKGSGIYEEDEFGIKHYLFVTFMTFAMWFVAWGILLAAQYPG